MNPYWQSLAAPWRQRANERKWLSLVGLQATLLLTGVLILFIGKFSPNSMLISALVVLMMSTHGFWMLHISATVLLNQPACVLLVPRYLQVQRRALLALWLGLALLQTAAFVTARALGLTQLVDGPALWLLVCAGGLLFWTLAIRWSLLVGTLFLLSPIWLRPLAAWVDDRPVPLIHWADLGHYAMWWAVPILAAMAWMLSRIALRPGDAAHRAQSYRNAIASAVLLDGNPVHAHRLSGRLSKVIALFETPFHLYARWLLASPRTGPTNTLAKAELGLGARTHWVMQAVNTCVIFSAFALLAFGYELVWGNAWETFANPATILGLGVITLTPLAAWRMALRLTTKEQALMLLLPGMPQGVSLNQALAKRHLRHLIVSWLALAALVICLPWPSFIRIDAQLLSVVTLPLLALAIQDWSRVAPLTGWQWVTGALGAAWVPAALIALHLHVPMLWLAALSLVLFVATALWRWRRLGGFAQAFPVGHRLVASS